MAGLYSHITRSTGTILTAAIYNADHVSHITNFIPAMMDDYSTTVVEMQTTADPGEVGTENQPTTLAGELERIRFILKEITGKTEWYETPASDIGSLVIADDIIANNTESNILSNQIFG